MPIHDWSKVPKEQMNPHLVRQAIHGAHMTVARLELKKGASVPEHHHHNEQIAMVQSGKLRWVIAGEERITGAGESVELPPHVPHSVEVLEDTVVFDLFAPRRDDWIRGDDAYLRK